MDLGYLDIVPEGSPQRVEYNLQYCSLTLIFFDYILTINDEIEYVWKDRWRTSTLLYMLCRYALLTNVLYVISVSERFPSISCQTGYTICGILSVFGRIGILGVWGLRTYAIYEKSRKILYLLVPLGMACLVSAVVNIPVMRCRPEEEPPVFRTVVSACMITFEVLAFVLASVRLWKTLKEEDSKYKVASLRRKKNLHALLFRQGFFYILAVVGLSVGSLTLNITAWKGSFLQRLLNGVKVPLSGFLTARLILRLRKWDRYRKEMRDFSLRVITITEHGTATTGPPSPPLETSCVRPRIPPEDLTKTIPGTASSDPPVTVPSPSSCPPDSSSGLPPELDKVLTELGDDIGPQPPEEGTPEEEEEYEWNWDSVEPEDMARRKSQRKGKQPERSSDRVSSSPGRRRRHAQDNAVASSSSSSSLPPVSIAALLGPPRTPSRKYDLASNIV